MYIYTCFVKIAKYCEALFASRASLFAAVATHTPVLRVIAEVTRSDCGAPPFPGTVPTSEGN